ncbi:hypothetical membrane protein, conserved [Thermococcus kodakarensis KOD1]|uniref:Hypothetical membrane protein, conserved n=1 Tax=Thermococcus kodakarensis (strain ATCC BAA-918 / JCM 12380 / KOD1) TaxID=69014 RepID=Q5JEL8_THEKO|nr:hypothetical membrane protein, conserved [Thermococcus kodakarensis KOD1]
MVYITRERAIIKGSIFVVFLGFLTAVINGRSDHIYRTIVAILGLSIPLVLPKKLLNPPEKVKPFLSPVYDERTMAVLGIFIAVHVSLVNVPFTHYDLFHRDWRNADMISHFLGGLTVWLIVAQILSELEGIGIKLSKRQVVLYTFIVFYVLSLGWEVAEKLSESEISFIHESLTNKLRDLLMDTLGALFGWWVVEKRRYPFGLGRD